jgi:GNAT superfamily N-acetyltransferase
MNTVLDIRALEPRDPNVIEAAFTEIGWHKPASQYHLYLAEQAEGRRAVFVGTLDGAFVGYATLVWQPRYPYFRARGIPEIQDLNVLPKFRRRGFASQLVAAAEALAATRVDTVGIGVGLHPGYNAAQRMYVLRGYVPDGQGVAYDTRYVAEGELVRFDDYLVLYFTKPTSR